MLSSAGKLGAVTCGVGVGLTSVLSAYLGIVTVAGLTSPGFGRRSLTTLPSIRASRRFAILIPAHNEAAVIRQALSSLTKLDYPSDAVQVHVVADNCTDATAEIVRDCGFIAHERDDLANAGKGPALNWLHQRLCDSNVAFDAVVILDADTSVAPLFLQHISAAFERGAVAAQGFYGVRDPDESASAGLRYAALACRHHLRPLGRTRLGGSCGLYGNGMAFDASIMRSFSWSGHLTEDMEFQNELLLAGHTVVYVPGAAIEAEMPDSLDASTGQNERWELGRIQMAQRYVPQLIRGMAKRSSTSRAAAADGVLDHLVPPLSVLALANGATLGASVALRAIRRGRLDRWNVIASAVATTTLLCHVLAGLWSAEAPRSVYRSLAQAPRMILWKAGLWRRVLVEPHNVTWTRTARNTEFSPSFNNS